MSKRKYQFTVKGLPPKKDGSQSMWGKPLEARRLIELRQATLSALHGNSPLRTNIKLTLKIHIGSVNDRNIGDLDTFVAGVCDGLMAAAPGGKPDILWNDERLECIYPSKDIAIVDDSQVINIQAEKIVSDNKEPWYEIVLEGE